MKSNNDLSESAGSIIIINNSADLNYDNNSIDKNEGIDTAIRFDSVKNTEIQI
jgi:hypothetical protein